MEIPENVFQLYEDLADDFIDSNFGINCKLYYPPKRVACSCTTNPVSGGSSNKFFGSGPAPFNFGQCALCGGDGYTEEIVSETIKFRVYYTPKDFIKIVNVEVPQGAIQIIGRQSDMPSFLRANEIEPNSDKAGFKSERYKRLGNCHPHGFKRRRYFVCFMELV